MSRQRANKDKPDESAVQELMIPASQQQQQAGAPAGIANVPLMTLLSAFPGNAPQFATYASGVDASAYAGGSGPIIANPVSDDEDGGSKRNKKDKQALRKRKRKPENMQDFIHSLNWPSTADRDEVCATLVDKNNLELNDILEAPDDLLLAELARAGVAKMGFRMKILNGRKQFLPKKRKSSEPRVNADGEPMPAGAGRQREKKLAMHRLEIAHDRYTNVKNLLASGKAASVHQALDQLDIKKSTFFDCKYVTEMKIIDEQKYNEIKAEMLEKRKTAKDFNTACYNYLKDLKRKGVRIDESKRMQLLPNSY